MWRFLLVFALVGCSATALDRVEETRPGAARGPAEAKAFAAAVIEAWRQGEYADEPAALASDTRQALEQLAATADESGPDPEALAWRGLALRAQGHDLEAAGALEGSFARQPSTLAGEALVLIYGEQKDRVSVGRICAALAPSITDPDERWRIVAVCRENVHAEAPAEELAWMSPALAQWYADEARRREAEAKRRADQERAAELRRRHHQQCMRACEQEQSFCRVQSMGDPGAPIRCTEVARSCTESCNAEVRR